MPLPTNMAATPRHLRRFALTTGALFAAIFGLLLPWLFVARWPIWPWAVAAGLAAWGLGHPASLRPVHDAWMRVADKVGRVNNYVILGIVFFVLITPFGWIRRNLGGDPLARRFDPAAKTYRKRKQARPANSLERPF